MAAFGNDYDFSFAENHTDFDYILSGVGDMPEYQVSQLRRGDLVLRRTGDREQYHAGVYCGDGEMIEFKAPLAQRGKKESGLKSVSSASLNFYGSVGKVGLWDFCRDQPYRVARPKRGVPGDFSQKVRTAMNTQETYNVVTNNSLQFALKLLGLR